MDYNLKLHRTGRIWTGAAVLMMCAVPILATIIMGTGPDWQALAISLVMLTVANLPVAVGEVFTYSYMLGTNGSYLAFITGNLSNLKIPCVINAVNIVGTKVGTEENELASTISIAVSAITTTLIIGIGILLLAVTNAGAVFQSVYLKPAFGVVAYALFGALGGQYLIKHPKIALLPFVGMTLIAVILVSAGVGGTVVKASYFVFVGVIACFFNARRLYYKECKAETAAASAALLGEPVTASDGAETDAVTVDATEDASEAVIADAAEDASEAVIADAFDD
ncbi:MAG: hypothetical protein LBT55_01630 [Clostridiaceae bacterium]|jgi:hypothetical protein|nr:hypothetical protein [Clostridiaceae bacterium]